jgi:hypothetical protein
MNHCFYSLLQSYVHAGYEREKDILLREFNLYGGVRSACLNWHAAMAI